MKKLLFMLSCSVVLAACASHTNKIPAAYISPLEYEDYSCKQVSSEMARVSRRAQQVAHDVDKNASGDATAVAVGAILFWPALFFIDGDTPQAQEYAELKGRFNALEEAAIQKNCKVKAESPFDEIEARNKPEKAPQGQNN